jgi:ADP-heptose:LPS heptosyltransferase
MKMIEKIGKRYLIILIIINVVFILFDLGVIIYANIELSNNIDDFIQVHLNMKNSIIMLLFVKSKFIVNKNKKETNKSFNALSKVESKKRKRNNMMDCKRFF